MTPIPTPAPWPYGRTLLVSIIIILGVVALGLVIKNTHTAPIAIANPVTAVHPDTPPDPLATPWSSIPEKLPIFSLADLAGKSTSISTWAGKSLILNFWATWCAPCRQEMPLLAVLHHDWAQRNVEVIGIAYDEPKAVKSFAEQYKIPYPLLVGEQDVLDVMALLGVQTPAFPFTLFTDRHGEVVALFMGELHRPQAELIMAEVELLNNSPPASTSPAAGTTPAAGTSRAALNAARRAIAAGLDRIGSP